MGQGSGGNGRAPTTAPPPFDPEQYARDSELAMRTVRPANLGKRDDGRSTAELPSAPPLNKRVRMNVATSELAWFDLSEAALAIAQRIDGSTTLLELMEGAPPDGAVEAVAQLHEAGLLEYEE
jgi:hypothetical protein